MPRIQIPIRTAARLGLLALLAVLAGGVLSTLAAFMPARPAATTLAAAAPDPSTPAVQELVLPPTGQAQPTPERTAGTVSPGQAALARAVQAELERLRAPHVVGGSTSVSSPATVVVRVATHGPNLNLRAGPGLDTAVLGSLPDGSEVVALARDPEGAWLRVMWNDLEGWLFAGLTQVVRGDLNALPVMAR